MDYNLITNIESCHIEIPRLLFYSHIPAMVMSLIFGFFVFIKNRTLVGKLLFSITLTFSAWLFLSLVVWMSYDSRIIMFAWSFFGILCVLLYILCLYFSYVFIAKKNASFLSKLILIFLFLPVVIFSFTQYNLSAFDIANCEAIERSAYLNYYYILGFVIFFCNILFLFVRYFKSDDRDSKKQIILFSVGVGLFLLFFFVTTYIASLIDNFELEQYGLFGMPIFLGLLAYLIVKYKAFNIKLIGAQALIVALVVILVGSQFFFAEDAVSDEGVQISEEFCLGVLHPDDLENASFFNHSCNPNAGFKGQIFLVAMRNIRKGEQITFDYAMVLSKSKNTKFYKMKCLCGLKKCRKYITDNDWKKPELQKKYKGYFQWYLQEKINKIKKF